MVNGLDVFRDYFKDHSSSYIIIIIIGGTACDVIMDAVGFGYRVTHDIDVVLVVEALTTGFVEKFWSFVKDGNYQQAERNEDDKKYYRFRNPANTSFPKQVELFSRLPDLLNVKPGTHLTPIPVGDQDLSSLSAILMNEDYYGYTLAHCTVEDGLQRANTEALICLKARAWLDMVKRKEEGGNVSDKEIKKHRGDIFRLSALLTDRDDFILPESIFNDLQLFASIIKNNLPEQTTFKDMGFGNIKPEMLFDQLIKSFKLSI